MQVSEKNYRVKTVLCKFDHGYRAAKISNVQNAARFKSYVHRGSLFFCNNFRESFLGKNFDFLPLEVSDDFLRIHLSVPAKLWVDVI